MSIMNEIKANENFLFNGFDFKQNLEAQGYQFIVNATRGRGVFGRELQTKKVIGVDGVTVLDTSLPPRSIEVDYTLKAPDLIKLREAESFLTILLQQSQSSKLYFSDQEGYYDAHFETLDVGYEDDKVQQGTITFFCPKPFRYKDTVTAFENKSVSAEEQLLINTESNYFSLPVIEIKATASESGITLEAGDSTIIYKNKINSGDVIVFDSEKMEVRHNGAIKVLEVEGAFPKLYTILNAVQLNISCVMTLKYRGVDV